MATPLTVKNPVATRTAVSESESTASLDTPLRRTSLRPARMASNSTTVMVASPISIAKPRMKLPKLSGRTPPAAAFAPWLVTEASVLSFNQPSIGGHHLAEAPTVSDSASDDDAQDEDAPLLENVHPEIVFGSFAQDSAPIHAAPLVPIKPKIDGSSIKIGEILCHFVSETNEKLEVVAEEDQAKHHQDPPTSQICVCVAEQSNLVEALRRRELQHCALARRHDLLGASIPEVSQSRTARTKQRRHEKETTVYPPPLPWFSNGKPRKRIDVPAKALDSRALFTIEGRVWFSDLHGVCVAVFDPGGSRRLVLMVIHLASAPPTLQPRILPPLAVDSDSTNLAFSIDDFPCSRVGEKRVEQQKDQWTCTHRIILLHSVVEIQQLGFPFSWAWAHFRPEARLHYSFFYLPGVSPIVVKDNHNSKLMFKPFQAGCGGSLSPTSLRGAVTGMRIVKLVRSLLLNQLVCCVC